MGNKIEKIAQDISSEVSYQLGLQIGEHGDIYFNYPDNFNKIMLYVGMAMAKKGYRLPPAEEELPLLGDEQLIELGYGMTAVLGEPPERCCGYLGEVSEAQRHLIANYLKGKTDDKEGSKMRDM